MSCNHLVDGGYWECETCHPPLDPNRPLYKPTPSPKDARIAELEYKVEELECRLRASDKAADEYQALMRQERQIRDTMERERDSARNTASRVEEDAAYYQKMYYHAADDEKAWRKKYHDLEEEMTEQRLEWSGVCYGWTDELDRLERAWWLSFAESFYNIGMLLGVVAVWSAHADGLVEAAQYNAQERDRAQALAKKWRKRARSA